MKVFSPPFDEFEVASVSVAAGDKIALPVNAGPQLLLIQAGGGTANATPPPGAGLSSHSASVLRTVRSKDKKAERFINR